MKSSKAFLSFVILLFASQISFSQDAISKTVLKELEEAEKIMFEKIPKFDSEYFKNYVHKDYITINADGVMKNKAETLADSARKKMFEGVTCKIFDRKVRLYGNVAIINGRSQYLMGEKVLGEVYHTEIWLKEKGKWMFDGWQGTLTKEAMEMMMSQKK